MGDYQDRILVCCDCATEFVFTAGEQRFFDTKELRHEPKRCRACKARRKAEAPLNGGKVETSTRCSQCGRETTVPFRPTQGRPVFCRECFNARRTQTVAATASGD